MSVISKDEADKKTAEVIAGVEPVVETVVETVEPPKKKKSPKEKKSPEGEKRDVPMIRNGIEYKVFKSKIQSFLDAGWKKVGE